MIHKAKNNCTGCRFAESIPTSSHHILCNIIADPLTNFLIAFKVADGDIKALEVQDKPNESISFNKHGQLNGWCNWPINFDPIWVECTINIDESLGQLNIHKS